MQRRAGKPARCRFKSNQKPTILNLLPLVFFRGLFYNERQQKPMKFFKIEGENYDSH